MTDLELTTLTVYLGRVHCYNLTAIARKTIAQHGTLEEFNAAIAKHEANMARLERDHELYKVVWCFGCYRWFAVEKEKLHQDFVCDVCGGCCAWDGKCSPKPRTGES